MEDRVSVAMIRVVVIGMVKTRLKAKHWAAIIERWCSVTESIYPLFTPLQLFEGTHIGEVRM